MEIIKFLSWYIYFILFGIIGLPIANYLFKDWRDKGYPMAKAIGLFVTAAPLWFLSSLKILPFNTYTAFLMLLINFSIAIYFIVKNKIQINKYMLIEEAMFLVVMIIWALVRSINPRVEGTEKFMNLAFMNSIDNTTFFPPKDPWYQSGNINYYYFGHYLTSFVGKLTGQTMAYAYNFSLITIITQLFTSIVSICMQLAKKLDGLKALIIGALISIIITFGGNLHYTSEYLTSIVSGEEFSYYFPDATRIINKPFTINEFPSYSIVLADVHPHYMSLPFFILMLALTVASFSIKLDEKSKHKYQIKLLQEPEIILTIDLNRKIIFNLMISPIIIALYMINSWDFVTSMFIFGVLHLYQAFRTEGSIFKKLNYFFLAQIALVLPGLILVLPYLITFKPPVGGVGLVPLTKKSDLIPWLQMWGIQLIITLLFILGLVFKMFETVKKKTVELINWPTILALCALCLIFGVEVFFLKDIFYKSNPDYFRTNTVFKFYYHAWIIWGIAAGWFSYKLLFEVKKRFELFRIFSGIVLIILFFSSFVYIFKAVDDFYHPDPTVKRSLNGEAYIERFYPSDYSAIMWMRENIKGQPVVVEAVGDAYSYFARISTHTGLQTVIGWPTHEWQWRDDSVTVFQRKDDVQKIYTSNSVPEVMGLLEKYKVKYVYIGLMEKQTYKSVNYTVFNQNGKLIYNEGDTQIYEMNTFGDE